MDWLAHLSQRGVVWLGQPPPATADDIAMLMSASARPLPSDYVQFLQQANGGIISYQDYWEIKVLSTFERAVWSSGYGVNPETMPAAWLFGDLPGGEGVVFDMRAQHEDGDYPIYAVNYITIGWDEVIWVAESFTALLALQRGMLDAL